MKKLLFLICFSMFLIACTDEDYVSKQECRYPINLSGAIEQVNATRAGESGFVNGDVAGVYIVDYDGAVPGTLTEKGNRADNLRLTFNEALYKWDMAYDVYFKDANTNIDVYSYYPYSDDISSVNNWTFEVSRDQNSEGTSHEKGGYEKSDLLWGKAENIVPGTQIVRIKYNHLMAGVKVVLVEGDGFGNGEWAGLKKQVLLKNTKSNASIDLANGKVVATGSVSSKGIIPYQKDDYFRAVVIPQTIINGTTLFDVEVGNVSYSFSRNDNLEYVGGKMNSFTFQVNKKGLSGDYEFKLIGESILAWENDDVSHDATLKEYVIINNTKAGHLDEAIVAAGKDLTTLRNLKLTGEINSHDFATMRFKMLRLQALNLKDVKIVKGEGGNLGDDEWYDSNNEDEIPNGAMSGKETLTSLILPDQLKAIRGASGGGVGRGAFSYCYNLTGSLIIPEGVEVIEHAAFQQCTNLNGSLSLPSTLKILGYASGYSSYWDGPFNGCGFICELKLPDGLKEIGMGAFCGCSGLYGELKLPEGLELLGESSFSGCKNLTGSLSIPQGVTIIPNGCFSGMGLNGNLELHEGIAAIGERAFAETPLKGVLELPKGLKTLSHEAFLGCDFSGELKLPKGLEGIGNHVFGNEWNGNWRLMGILEIPQNVVSIGEGAFQNCRSIEGLILPEGLENIRNNAFSGCFGIGSIVCKSTIPPYVLGNAFDGVPKDNFTLEVPESAVPTYKADQFWMSFKRIAAHHELVCRPSVANALNTKCNRTLVLNAEGEWIVESKPDWVTLSQMEGNNKTELTLTFSQMAAGTPNREGEVVFKLKNKDYRSKCVVRQYDYEYGEDEIITLQQATKGNNGGINLVFLGDGYDAKDISEGKMMANVKEEVENFFAIEPYKTYREYFNVFTAIPVSTESGIGTINTIRYAKFETTYAGGVGLRGDYDAIFDYCLRIPQVTPENIGQLTTIIIPNSTEYGGICWMWENGSAIAYCPLSDYGYPLDTRGVVQHEAGGHGFGKLADEYIYHNAFIDMCNCPCCGHVDAINSSKSFGWYENISLTGKMHEVGWSHLIFDSRYSDIVDIFEGAYMHTRGVYRSEQNSCMNNDVPYYSTISRESIVRRIKKYAGEQFDFEEFVANDSKEPGDVKETRSGSTSKRTTLSSVHSHPVIMKGAPKITKKNRK